MSEFHLEKYKGMNTRHECPACHDKHSFTFYVDECGNILDRKVGRCDHESRCGYHYTPKEYYRDNPDKRDKSDEKKDHVQKVKPQQKKKLCFIDKSYVVNSLSYNSDFVYFLSSIFDRYTMESPTIERLMRDYLLGATKDGDVSVWYIDKSRRTRGGKIMRYDKETGHRCHMVKPDWVHSRLKKSRALPDEWELSQCLFGEHLLSRYPDKAVALVESEKTAIIASGVYPDYVWVATGGKRQWSGDKLRALSGRTVVMFPDVDGYEEWCAKAKEMPYCRVTVSDVLERMATDEEREAQIDIADWLINDLKEEDELSPSERCLMRFKEMNPAIGLLINEFDLSIAS